jgi:hypothetical protein
MRDMHHLHLTSLTTVIDWHGRVSLGLVLSSTQSRFEEYPNIKLDAGDSIGLESLHCKADIFQPEAFHYKSDSLGVDPADLVRSRNKWVTTSPKQLNLGQQELLLTLMSVDSAIWPKLWLASLFRSHMIIRSGEGPLWYVAYATQYRLSAYELKPLAGSTDEYSLPHAPTQRCLFWGCILRFLMDSHIVALCVSLVLLVSC